MTIGYRQFVEMLKTTEAKSPEDLIAAYPDIPPEDIRDAWENLQRAIAIFKRLQAQAEEIDAFLTAMAIDADDPILDEASWNGLLEDARTVKAILSKYNRRAYAPPVQKSKSGPMSSYLKYANMIVFEGVDRREVIELAARETYGPGYDDLYPKEKQRERDRARKGIDRALKKLLEEVG